MRLMYNDLPLHPRAQDEAAESRLLFMSIEAAVSRRNIINRRHIISIEVDCYFMTS